MGNIDKRCFFCREVQNVDEHHIIPKALFNGVENNTIVPLCPNCHRKVHVILKPLLSMSVFLEFRKLLLDDAKKYIESEEPRVDQLTLFNSMMKERVPRDIIYALAEKQTTISNLARVIHANRQHVGGIINRFKTLGIVGNRGYLVELTDVGKILLRKESENRALYYRQTNESLLVETLIEMVKRDDWYTIKAITTEFSSKLDSPDWVRPDVVGRMLKRIGVSEKRRVSRGYEYHLTPEIVQSLSNRYRSPIDVGKILLRKFTHNYKTDKTDKNA
jgi:uncharacterized protein YlaI